MNIRENETDKLLEIWLTNAECQDETISASLQPLFEAYKARGYFPVVYESGEGDLLESIRHLLLHNRKVLESKETVVDTPA